MLYKVQGAQYYLPGCNMYNHICSGKVFFIIIYGSDNLFTQMYTKLLLTDHFMTPNIMQCVSTVHLSGEKAKYYKFSEKQKHFFRITLFIVYAKKYLAWNILILLCSLLIHLQINTCNNFYDN